jgi:riboflavin kinase/FMN adenylyltransferase
MMNIGQKPTVGDNSKTLEVNIFDFNHDIYGNGIKVRFVKRIRDERKFENLQELKKQLLIDRNKARQILI